MLLPLVFTHWFINFFTFTNHSTRDYFLPSKIPPFHKITPTDSTKSRLTKVAIIMFIVVFKVPIAHKIISTDSTNNKLKKTPKIIRQNNLLFLFFVQHLNCCPYLYPFLSLRSDTKHYENISLSIFFRYNSSL